MAGFAVSSARTTKIPRGAETNKYDRSVTGLEDITGDKTVADTTAGGLVDFVHTAFNEFEDQPESSLTACTLGVLPRDRTIARIGSRFRLAELQPRH